MEEKDYRFLVNFTTTYQIEVRAKSKEEAQEYAENDAYDMFREDLDTGYLGTSDFAMSVEEK